MNFGGVGDACSSSCETKQKIPEDSSGFRKGLNRKISKKSFSNKKKVIRELEEKKSRWIQLMN